MPSSMPAGTFTLIDCMPSLRPEPRQSRQRSRTISPAPEQASQGRLIRKKPCWSTTCPLPWQREQGSGLVPGRAPLPPQVPQGRILGIWIWASIPSSTSRSSISRL